MDGLADFACLDEVEDAGVDILAVRDLAESSRDLIEGGL